MDTDILEDQSKTNEHSGTTIDKHDLIESRK